MNRVLVYAGKYMKNLEHFGFGFSNHSLSTYNQTQGWLVLKFNSEYLRQFLLHSHPLKSFDLQFQGYPQCVNEITNGGRALLPLSTHHGPSLHTLILSNPYFARVSDFATMLSGFGDGQSSSLRSLNLDGLSVGPNVGHWSLQDAKTIAETIQNIGTLEYLNFREMEDRCLHGRDDTVLAVMLENKPNLRHFGVSAVDPFEAEYTHGRQVKGSITDRSLKVVVNKVGATVQDLNFYYQSQITVAGLETILTGCPLLRNVVIIGKEFTPKELERLLPLSNSLINIVFGKYAGAGGGDNPKKWIPAILATEGRILIRPDRGSDISLEIEDQLPSACVKNLHHSRKMVAKYNKNMRDKDVPNKWDFLL